MIRGNFFEVSQPSADGGSDLFGSVRRTYGHLRLDLRAIFAAVTTLGGRRGTYAVGVYLLLGLVGLPVFAGFRSGPGTLLGTTGGYILGFFVCAVVYWLVTAWLGESLWAVFLGGALGLAACYAFGTAWFLLLYIRTTGPMSLGAALGMCVVPYVLPDLCKLALAILVSRRVRPHLR